MRIPEKMNFRSLRTVYMGTPDFAVGPLLKLLDAGLPPVGAVIVDGVDNWQQLLLHEVEDAPAYQGIPTAYVGMRIHQELEQFSQN